MKEHLSVSTLNINCPLKLYKKMHGEKPQTLPNDSALDGRDAHAEVEKKINPLSLLGLSEKDGWEYVQEFKVEYKVNGKKFISVPDMVCWNAEEKRGIIVDAKNRLTGEIYDTDKFQLLVYAFWLMQEYEAEEVETYIYFIPYKRLERVERYLLIDVPQMEEKIIERIRYVEEALKNPIPHDGRDCQYCPYVFECPLYQEKIDVEKEGIEKVIGKILSQIWVAKQVIKQGNKVLQSYMKGNNLTRLEAGGLEAGWYPTTTAEIDEVAFLKEHIREKLGLEMKQVDALEPVIQAILEVAPVSKQKAKREAKKNELLTAFVTEVPGKPRFEVKPTKKEEA